MLLLFATFFSQIPYRILIGFIRVLFKLEYNYIYIEMVKSSFQLQQAQLVCHFFLL